MAKITNEKIHRLADRLGAPLYRKRYRMWKDVWHLGSTALVFDTVVPGGGYMLTNDQGYPDFCDINYIEGAVLARAASLGEITFTNRGLKYKKWEETLGKRAPGYYLGKVGDDIPSI